MGVRGLYTFMKNNRDKMWVKYELHDCKIVIDGNNVFTIMAESMDWNPYGGDCDKFYQKVKQFFEDLIRCNIECYVIFDTILNPDRLRRFFDNHQEALIRGYSDRARPMICERVFKQVVQDLNIYNHVGGNQEMASLAAHLNCPIISNDTAFVIFNIKCIPWQFIDKSRRKRNTNTMSMSCVMYDAKLFQEHFRIGVEVLPLLSILTGNDYMDEDVVNEFLNKIQTENYYPLEKVMSWLRDKSLESACNEFFDMFPNRSKDSLKVILQERLNKYKINCSQLVEEFTNKKAYQVLVDPNNNSDNGSIRSQVEYNGKMFTCYVKPDWLLNKIRGMSVKLPGSFVNLYVWRMYTSTLQFQNYEDKDIFVPILPILRYAFDILMDFKVDNFLFNSRNLFQLKHQNIDRSYSLKKPDLKSFSICDQNESHLYFHYFVKNNFPGIEQYFQILPQEFKLIFISLLWFIKTCEVSSTLVYSLVLSYVTLGIVHIKSQNVKSFKNCLAQLLSDCHLERDLLSSDQENSDPQMQMSTKSISNTDHVLIDHCHKAKSSLCSFFNLQDQNPENSLLETRSDKIKKVHLMMQYLVTIIHINHLNDLFGQPYTIHYSKFYNGTFVHNVWHTIQTIGLKDFNLKYLQHACTVNQFYMFLLDVLDQAMKNYDLTFCDKVDVTN